MDAQQRVVREPAPIGDRPDDRASTSSYARRAESHPTVAVNDHATVQAFAPGGGELAARRRCRPHLHHTDDCERGGY
jgi:hypothetical protein